MVNFCCVIHYCKIGPLDAFWADSSLMDDWPPLFDTWRPDTCFSPPPSSIWSTPLDISNSKGRLLFYSLRWRLLLCIYTTAYNTHTFYYIYIYFYVGRYILHSTPSPFFRVKVSTRKEKPISKIVICRTAMCWICVCRRQQLFPLRQQHLNFTSFPSVWCASLIIIMNLSTQHTTHTRMCIICRRESTFSRVRHWRSFYTVTQIECWMRVWVVYQKKLEGWRFEWRRKLLVFIEINSSFDVAVLYVYGLIKE